MLNNKSTHYDEIFYAGQASASFISAQIYAHHLHKLLKPRTIVDFGCGRGSWLRAFSAMGVNRLVGYDGPWNSQDKMEDQAIFFISADLNRPIECKEYFDLAISLEVAEHLLPENADTFIQSLTKASDLVLFGAAPPGQGGTDHINEQPPSYWAKKFLAHGYHPFDIFRPSLWGNRDVCFWYRQNTFLYARGNSTAFSILQSHHLAPVISLDFMDCIHPELYELTTRRGRTGHKIRNIVRPLFPKSLLDVIARWRHSHHA